ncbi:helix-turn-helix domain-containing protein [Mesorhizobium sp. CU2]|uniref:AraC family transcriptional regulator ligand-binding domain-containing protein n=1 Tax=unclassified Mesorhizobium TaxID=325217 RepID=UPI001127B805|nr:MULTISPECIES: AraC family transcriptional regulator ligand-binding domain-containing protein [unclassified Mesorhizobium]TPN81099.1 helix-turn-helix domain-containing protein [Mesorhizobium sp. CU3]TPO11680.1 helix-turn-helix domain-containing protein [Mesorhizobium sp. CU2]
MKASDPLYVTANIPAFLIRSLAATLADFGIEVTRLLVGLGITVDDLADPSCRVSFRQGRLAILRALKLAKGRALGLESGLRQKITSAGLVGYAMLTAPTVGDAVELGIELQKDVGSMLRYDTRCDEQGVVVTATSRFHDPDTYVFLVEESFASFMGIAAALMGNDFKPIRVDVTYPAPPYVDVYRRIFRCPVHFGQVENAFIFDKTFYERPLATADPFSHRQLLDFIAHSRVRKREAAEIIESVERVLRHRLQERNHVVTVARELGMSERTLRRRLGENGVSFQSVLDQLRKDRALELLANSQVSVEQIAFLVGFTDPHNFRRAFRRWTGETPGVLRDEMKGV